MRSFNETYPNGLKQSIVLFKKAICQIMTTDEIDKVIRDCDEPDEVAHLNHLKDQVHKKQDITWWQYNWIPLLYSIDSPCLLRDIIATMVTLDDLEFYKEPEN